MILTVLQIACLRLWNNKQELFLVFFVPVVFFSIFALIFDRGVAGKFLTLRLATIDDIQNPESRILLDAISKNPTLKIEEHARRSERRRPPSETAADILRRGRSDLVLRLARESKRGARSESAINLQLFYDGGNPIHRHVALAALSEAMSGPGVGDATDFELRQGGGSLRSHAPIGDRLAGRPTSLDSAIQTTEVFATRKQNPRIAMYAAGIAVMFVLFSSTAAGGSLLEEHEAGTLERLLCTRLNLDELLLGKWLYIWLLGILQLVTMFAWAEFAFDVALGEHLHGFAVITACTAAAAASFAIFLAVICRSRAQLNGASITIVLTMSALGGSMVPRYVMTDSIQHWGKLTFNAWALDGYQKVFWYESPMSELRPQVLVLAAMAFVFGVAARLLASRWATD